MSIERALSPAHILHAFHLHTCAFLWGNIETQRQNNYTTRSSAADARCVERQTSHACGSRTPCTEEVFRRDYLPHIRKASHSSSQRTAKSSQSVVVVALRHPPPPDKDNGVMSALACYVTDRYAHDQR